MRGANVLSASYSRPKDDNYDWSRQYQLNFKEERAQDGARLVLLIDEAEKTATFVAPQPKRMELDKGRSTDAAREDADTPIDTEWSGLAEVAYEATEGHKARGFDATSRNARRARMRAVDADDDFRGRGRAESEGSRPTARRSPLFKDLGLFMFSRRPACGGCFIRGSARRWRGAACSGLEGLARVQSNTRRA